MANVTIPPTGTGTATPVIATDTVAGVEYQKIKVDVGAAGASSLVTAANPLPVVQTGTPALPTGAATEATLDARTGTLTEAAPGTDTASSGINGRLQRIAQRLTSLIALLPTSLGSGGGLKVDGSGTALPVSGTVTANAGTNLNTSALALDATVGTTNTEVGGLTEAAPASDTASSGLNGRLQRIAQRLTSLIAVFTIGAGTEAAAVRVTLPTDGTGKVNAAQSGTWTVQPGNTANSTAWKVDGSAVTQPVSYATTGSGNATGALRVELPTNGTGVIAAVTAITNALPAGTNGIGKLTANSGVVIGDVNITTLPIVNPIVRVTQTPTVSTSPAYTAKDAVGGLLTFANAVRVSGGAGQLLTVTVIDNSQQRPSLELVLFDRTFTASTDNAIFAPSDGDLANCIGVVAINNWSDFSTNSIATVSAVGLGFVLNATSLFGQLVTRGTPTFVATNDIIVSVDIVQA